jgi:alpha-beta hydrolase superfamily lysophospholipase
VKRKGCFRERLKNKMLIVLVLFILIFNIEAAFHAYKFTHYSKNEDLQRTDSNKLTLIDKVKILVFGVNNPRPKNLQSPEQPFETIYLKSNKQIECWRIVANESKGNVVLFHGFTDEKSSMLGRANEFIELGYSVLLVDFMGSGGSEGNQTTIGYYEAEEVKTCYEYLVQNNEKNIYLYGTSMGAAAILKSIKDFDLKPAGIILECPFGTMYKTVANRFTNMGVPQIPFVPLLVFWGGLVNGFWGFSHNPVDYASYVSCPTLLFYGEKDSKVTQEEITEIFENLNGKKLLKQYECVGHDDIYSNNSEQWTRDIIDFMFLCQKEKMGE